MGSLLDQVAAEDSPNAQQPAPQQATTPTSGGSLLDQVAAEEDTKTTNPPPVTDPPKVSAWEAFKNHVQTTVGSMVPQAIVPALEAGKKYLSDPLEKAGEATTEAGADLGRKPAEMLSGMKNLQAYLPSSYGQKPSIEALEDTAKREHPALSGIGEGVGKFVGSLASPENLAIMAAMPEAEARPILSKIISSTFGAQMAKGAKDEVQNLIQNWDKMTPQQRYESITDSTLSTAMATGAVLHAADKIKGESPEKPVAPVEDKTTQSGKRTTFRPTTVKTAGVDAPIPASAQENPNIATRVASNLASRNKAVEFQKNETAPAAAKQLVSTVGQTAEDKIAGHEALMNGDPRPEPIAGTQTPSKFEDFDDIYKAAHDTASKTYQKADEISARETQEWQAKVDEARQEHQGLVDQHNQNVDEFNGNLGDKEDPMQRMEFHPEDAKIPEKPATYNDLKSALDKAKRDSVSSDAVVRGEAYDVGIPKAEKAIDNWFRQHSDEISPAEYASAKHLYGDAERFGQIAQALRQPLKEGNLTGQQMRQVEASMNKAAFRRGQTPDAFQRLLGPEGYENWNTVKTLFDPAKGLPSGASWGSVALSFLADRVFGAVTGLEAFGGLTAGRWLLNRVLFDPEFGSLLKNTADYIKSSRPAEVASSAFQLPKELYSKALGLLERSKSTAKGLLKNERGTAAAPGMVPLTEEDEQVAAHHADGGSTFDMDGKNLNGADKYSVGSYTDRAQHLDDLTPEDLRKFKVNNMDVLSEPDHAVGTWKDPDTGKHVVDVAKLYDNRDDAVNAGQQANQKSIYHLGSNELISTGGTGDKTVNNVVDSYNDSVGKPPVVDNKVPIDHRADAIADAYDKLKHNPKDPKVRKSYDALIQETRDQWHALEAAGYKLQVESQDPYGLDSSKPAYQEMAEDVKNNKRIKVWDGGKPPSNHPLSEIDPETGVTNNTLFRAVHDIMGHVAGDNDFSQRGEENAYQRHAQSYSEEALPALTTETKGQTSHYFNNSKVRAGGTPDFVDQRAALLPEKFYGKQVERSRPEATKKWPTPDALIKKYGEAGDPAQAGFLFEDGHAAAIKSTEHDRMLGGKPTDDLRTPFVNETGAIRMRSYGVYGGKQFNLSLPETGITPEQLEQLNEWSSQMKTGTVHLEVAKPDGQHISLEQGSPDLEKAIRSLVPIRGDARKTTSLANKSVRLIPNASGESSASQEAMNRLASEKKDGVSRVVVNTLSGEERPLIGTDAVDYQPRPTESVEYRGGNRDGEVINRGDKARPYQRKSKPVQVGSAASTASDNDLFAKAKAELGPDASWSAVGMRAGEMAKARDQQLKVERARTEGTAAAKAATDSSFPNPFATPSLESKEITTRRPTAVKGDKSNQPSQYADLAAINQAGENSPSRKSQAGKDIMGYKEKMARTISEYTGVNYTPEELKNPDKVINKFVDHVSDNLEWLYNQIPEELRAKTRNWYRAAHQLLKGFANDYGYSHEQAAGVTAALSPQNPWDNNVGLAKRMMDIYKNRQDFKFTPKMESKSADFKSVPTQSKAFNAMLDEIHGKSLREVVDDNPDVQAAKRGLWIRLYDEAHDTTPNDQYSPTGEVAGHSPDVRSWIGLDHLSKAVKIMDDGSVENINRVMGQGHKIRNFYNNLINPDSKNGHVTIDTHATAAGMLQPYGSKDTETAHTFGNSTKGIPGPPKDASTGLQGTYPLYAEAYQRVAKKLGIFPRELQSVTWEAIKSLMGDEKKTPELKAKVKQIWQDVQDGRLTINEAREMIKDESGGFSKPAWMSDEEWERMGDEGDDTSFGGQ